MTWADQWGYLRVYLTAVSLAFAMVVPMAGLKALPRVAQWAAGSAGT